MQTDIYIYGEVNRNCQSGESVDLLIDPRLLPEWTPQRHSLFAVKIREQIKTLFWLSLLNKKKNQPNHLLFYRLPRDLLCVVSQFLCMVQD
jgi:hypothetical protein